MKRHPESGFSLVELAISMSIVLVVSALATPSVVSSLAAIKMTSTAQNFASLLQDARMKAARDNKTYVVSCVQYDLTTNPTTIDNCNVIFIDVDASGTYNTSGSMSKMEIAMQVSSAVKFTTTAPSPALDSTLLSFDPNPTAASVSPVGMARFNPRGMACQIDSGTCKNIAASGQTGFLYYLTSRDALGNQHYGAVSVSPSGRIKVWKFNGTAWN